MIVPLSWTICFPVSFHPVLLHPVRQQFITGRPLTMCRTFVVFIAICGVLCGDLCNTECCKSSLLLLWVLWRKCVHQKLSFIHSIGMCRMQQFLAVLRNFFHSSLLYTFTCHPSPPTTLPSSLTSSCHLFLDLPLNLVVPKFIYNTLLGILFSSILFTFPNQCNVFNLIVSVIVGFLTLA